MTTAHSASEVVARLLRRRRRQLGLTLRDVSSRTAELGRPVPFSTLAKIETARLDPGLKRLHGLLRVYDLPIEAIGDALDLEEIAAEQPKETDPQRLYELGAEHWKQGRPRRALACLMAVRKQKGTQVELQRQKALLHFAIASGSLGKYRLALQIAQDLLLEPPHETLLVPVLVQHAVSWNGLGCPEAALAFLERAQARMDPDDPRSAAWVHHEKAVAQGLLGLRDEAHQELDEALACYREAEDSYGESRGLGLRITLDRAAGDIEAARAAASLAREHAEREGFDRLRTLRQLIEGHLMVLTGDTDDGLDLLNRTLAATIASADEPARFYAHYYLWKAHEQLGHKARANLELEAAKYHVRFVDEASEEAEETRKES